MSGVMGERAEDYISNRKSKFSSNLRRAASSAKNGVGALEEGAGEEEGSRRWKGGGGMKSFARSRTMGVKKARFLKIGEEDDFDFGEDEGDAGGVGGGKRPSGVSGMEHSTLEKVEEIHEGTENGGKNLGKKAFMSEFSSMMKKLTSPEHKKQAGNVSEESIKVLETSKISNKNLKRDPTFGQNKTKPAPNEDEDSYLPSSFDDNSQDEYSELGNLKSRRTKKSDKMKWSQDPESSRRSRGRERKSSDPYTSTKEGDLGVKPKNQKSGGLGFLGAGEDILQSTYNGTRPSFMAPGMNAGSVVPTLGGSGLGGLGVTGPVFGSMAPTFRSTEPSKVRKESKVVQDVKKEEKIDDKNEAKGGPRRLTFGEGSDPVALIRAAGRFLAKKTTKSVKFEESSPNPKKAKNRLQESGLVSPASKPHSIDPKTTRKRSFGNSNYSKIEKFDNTSTVKKQTSTVSATLEFRTPNRKRDSSASAVLTRPFRATKSGSRFGSIEVSRNFESSPRPGYKSSQMSTTRTNWTNRTYRVPRNVTRIDISTEKPEIQFLVNFLKLASNLEKRSEAFRQRLGRVPGYPKRDFYHKFFENKNDDLGMILSNIFHFGINNEQIEQVVGSLDRDFDGKISYSEFVYFVYPKESKTIEDDYEIRESQKELFKTIWHSVDPKNEPDSDFVEGSLCILELLKIEFEGAEKVQAMLQTHQIRLSERRIEYIFDLVKNKNAGFIDKKTIYSFVTPYDHEFDFKDAKRALRRLDCDEIGKISLSIFQKFLMRFKGFLGPKSENRSSGVVSGARSSGHSQKNQRSSDGRSEERRFSREMDEPQKTAILSRSTVVERTEQAFNPSREARVPANPDKAPQTSSQVVEVTTTNKEHHTPTEAHQGHTDEPTPKQEVETVTTKTVTIKKEYFNRQNPEETPEDTDQKEKVSEVTVSTVETNREEPREPDSKSNDKGVMDILIGENKDKGTKKDQLIATVKGWGISVLPASPRPLNKADSRGGLPLTPKDYEQSRTFFRDQLRTQKKKLKSRGNVKAGFFSSLKKLQNDGENGQNEQRSAQLPRRVVAAPEAELVIEEEEEESLDDEGTPVKAVRVVEMPQSSSEGENWASKYISKKPAKEVRSRLVRMETIRSGTTKVQNNLNNVIHGLFQLRNSNGLRNSSDPKSDSNYEIKQMKVSTKTTVVRSGDPGAETEDKTQKYSNPKT